MMAAATGGVALMPEPALDARVPPASAPPPPVLGVAGSGVAPLGATSRLQLEYHDSKSACIFSRLVPNTR
ncbi:hypothetical protein EON66_07260 [archaeon]|nr:MAG: hypothetical protein EON66_07260 [archaeon]